MTATAIPALSRREGLRHKSPRTVLAPSSRTAAAASEASPEEELQLRVLVIFEPQYRAYGDAIAGVIRELRPRVEVAVAEPADLRAEISRRSPHLVISSQPNTADPTRTPVWVELPHDSGLAGEICFRGRCVEAHDLALDDLLMVVDKTENLVRAS